MTPTKTGFRTAHFLSSVAPTILFGALAGTIVSVVVCLYKFCAKHVVHISHSAYAFLREHFLLALPVLVLFFLAGLFYAFVYKKAPTLKGGGIPTSIGALRGLFSLNWWKNAVGAFFLSLFSFLLGVPLGTEGPSVQMGTALGGGVVRLGSKKSRAWERFSMTGGACAGFSVATGAPMSGILFAIEEAHQRISPMIVLTSVVSVLSANLVSAALSPVLGIEPGLFTLPAMLTLPWKAFWIPLVLGLLLGLFSVLFLRFYEFLDRVSDRILPRIPARFRFFPILSLTLVFGIFSLSFVSTGHDLILSFFSSRPALWMLLLIVLIRSFLTLGANISGITGGTFLPLLAISATFAAFLGEIFLLLGMKEDLFSVVLGLGIGGCIAGLMKMPLTAILFSVEALGLGDNLLPVILVATLAFAVSEVFGAKSASDLILEHREEDLCRDKTTIQEELTLTISTGAFAVGKEVRDIFWPHGVRVLSVTHTDPKSPLLRAGDQLLLRCNTPNPEKTREELSAILGESSFAAITSVKA